MKKLFAEPLVHFLLIGGTLCLLFSMFSSQSIFPRSSLDIVIDDEVLARYFQFQNKSFKVAAAQQRIASMTFLEKEDLVDDYVRDEVLYREAIALGLEQNDEVVRRRLIQKMEFINQGFYSELPSIQEADLERFYKENIDLYQVTESISFTHVFLPVKNASDTAMVKLAATALLAELESQSVPFEDAGKYGKRFLFNRNYTERDRDYIGSHFGAGFEDVIFDLSVDELWQGPIQSQYGFHLVIVRSLSEARDSTLSEVASQVLSDLRRENLQARKNEGLVELVKKYQVIKDYQQGSQPQAKQLEAQ